MMNPFWMEHFCNFFSFLFFFVSFLGLSIFSLFCFLVAIINAASHVLPATGVICRKKETKGGLWHSGESVVPPRAIGQLATRLQEMEIEKLYGTRAVLSSTMYTDCGYTLSSKRWS